MNTTNNEAIGKLSNGENVFMRRTGKNTYEYVDGNSNKVDGRKVKKFSNIAMTKDTSVEKEKMKKMKKTPKPVIKKTYEELSKDWLRTYPKAEVWESDKEYEKRMERAMKKIRLTIGRQKNAEFNAEQKSKGLYKPYKSFMTQYYEGFDEQIKQRKENTTPKSVIKENVIIKKEEPKETTPKPVIEIADKEKTRLKKLEPKKQTADQLEKRRIKYQENREKELARKRAYREANKQELNAKQDAYRETGKSKAYQKAYREKNAKIYEPRRTKEEVEAGVKAYGLGKDVLRYMDDTNKLIKKYGTQTPRKVRTDAGNKRGEYKKKDKKELVKYPKPSKKSGENDEVFQTRLGLWDLVRQGKLPPSNLTMRKAILITYGDGIRSGGKDITTGEWIKSKEKAGRDIERDGLGVGNLTTAENDPDEVF